eukprot:1316010-Prymnesium_polylepis.2
MSTTDASPGAVVAFVALAGADGAGASSLHTHGSWVIDQSKRAWLQVLRTSCVRHVAAYIHCER